MSNCNNNPRTNTPLLKTSFAKDSRQQKFFTIFHDNIGRVRSQYGTGQSYVVGMTRKIARSMSAKLARQGKHLPDRATLALQQSLGKI